MHVGEQRDAQRPRPWQRLGGKPHRVELQLPRSPLAELRHAHETHARHQREHGVAVQLTAQMRLEAARHALQPAPPGRGRLARFCLVGHGVGG